MGVGTVDALIPPNALTVVLASLANIDVWANFLWLASGRGLLFGLYLVYVLLWMSHQTEEAPLYDVPHIPLKEKVAATLQYLLPLGFIVFMVIGFIFLVSQHLRKQQQQGPWVIYLSPYLQTF